MLEFIMENGATLLISAILLAVVAMIVLNLIKKKKSGKSVGCSCSCDGCPGVPCAISNNGKN